MSSQARQGSLKSRVRQLLLWPLYLPSLLSTAKSFKKNPVVGNRLLNLLGLHVIRVVLSAWIMHLRRLPLFWMMARTDRRFFRAQGYLLKENFLPPDLFNQLQQEALAAQLDARICLQGDAITHRVLLDHHTLKTLPAHKALLAHSPFLHTLGYCSGRLRIPGIWLHQVFNGVFPDKRDPQRNLHSDTFHPSIKAWLFLEDVPEEKGPFNYVPGSHRLSFKRLVWEYQRSLKVCGEEDHYSASGSFRITEEDRKTLGLPSAIAFTVKANSLVIADTHGFHCRGDAIAGSCRPAIWAISRTNPFNPLPGLPFRILNRLDLKLFRLHLQWQDRKAAKNNSQPSWRKVNPLWTPKQ